MEKSPLLPVLGLYNPSTPKDVFKTWRQTIYFFYLLILI